MEIRQLEYFVVVAEELHFAKAAKRLAMTQPPLSMQIQKLEQELEVSLLWRTNRRVELTQAGEQFRVDALRILEDINMARRTARQLAQGLTGRISIGFVGSATHQVMPPLLRSYRQTYPQVDVRLIELSTPDQIEELKRRRLDLGFIRLPWQEPGIETLTLDEEPSIVAIGLEDSLSGRTQLVLEDMEGHDMVILSRATWPYYHDEIMRLSYQKGLRLNIVQDAQEFQTVIGLVAGSIGCAIVPASVATLQRPDVTYRPLREFPKVVMGLAWTSDNISLQATRFIDLIRNGYQC